MRIAHEIEERAPEGAFVCFSVRSAFDLVLQALALPPGSEVLMSAITHPDMARIVERHGLVAVPVDLDLETLAPRSELLERALTPRTRLLVVAHLFGARADLTEATAFCARHGFLLVEDCAQIFLGPRDAGDGRAFVSLFSFGSIKTCPALGGAIAYVRDERVRAGMRRIQNAWPTQPRSEYFFRVLRFCGLFTLGQPLIYGAFVRAGGWAGLDVDALVNRSVHALQPPSSDAGDVFGAWLRRRPSAPLLALLRRRLKTFDGERLRRRAIRGEEAGRALPASVFHPGRAAPTRTHWVFPVAWRAPAVMIEALRRRGFDATAATSSISAIQAPPSHPELEPASSRRFMEQVVFLPVYPELPPRAFGRLLATIAELENERLGEGRVAGEALEPVRSKVDAGAQAQ
jgi:dTDP-4-amino-4,6-dideoxygalactose transaminase